MSDVTRCEIWGVLNVAPDSFSDGGRYSELGAALEHGRRLLSQGAHVVDVGGQSSRPAGRTYGSGARSVPAEVEAARVVPVVRALVEQSRAVRISVDTTKAEVARQALAAGATIVNDVSCGAHEELLQVVAASGAELVLMHTRGAGQIDAENTKYDDVVLDVRREVLAAAQRAVAHGVPRSAIWIDPGIGFAKTWDQSLTLLANLGAFVDTDHRVLVGASRKSFIAEVAAAASGRKPSPLEREGGTAAAVTASVLAGAHAVRVHEVDTMRQAAMVAQALRTRHGGRP
ncbi:MAG: dihydropteroate synthase [Proteobacteria bacterium]|nr:dihydropteroate synthase [Pseudomonadota bacterium]